MKTQRPRRRLGRQAWLLQPSLLLMFGASVLLYRTVSMIYHGAASVLVPWVAALIWIEMILDGACVVAAVPWFVASLREDDEDGAASASTAPRSSLPLRIGAACTAFHAFRVAIFVSGRCSEGRWKDFDVRPERRSDHGTRWEWWHVYFAGTLSALGLVVMLLIWKQRRSSSRSAKDKHQ